MNRILAFVVLMAVLAVGCGAEPTAAPTLAPTQPQPTSLPTATTEPSPTQQPTLAPTNTLAPTATPEPATGKVKSTLNVREQPSTRAKLLGVLNKDDIVSLVGRTEDSLWLQIHYPLGATSTAWVIAERVETTIGLDTLPVAVSPAPTVAATRAAAATVIVTATLSASTPEGTAPAGGTPAPTEAVATVEGTPAATSEAQATPAAPSDGGAPPGSLIYDVFENGGFNIYRVRGDGSGVELLISNGSDPALSPNGTIIAFRERKDTGGLGIVLSDLRGQNRVSVTEESAAGYPTWSPDGNNLAYHILPSGRLSGLIMRIGAGPNNSPTNIGIGVRPAWQPGNGLSVLFDGCKGAAACSSLLTQVAFQADPENPNLIGPGIAGAWSPDGARIAFQDTDETGSTQIFIMNTDGSDRRQVTTDVGTHGMPIWSADGQWLYYRTDQGGAGWAIYAIRTDGSGARKVVDANVHPDQWTYAKLAIAP